MREFGKSVGSPPPPFSVTPVYVYRVDLKRSYSERRMCVCACVYLNNSDAVQGETNVSDTVVVVRRFCCRGGLSRKILLCGFLWRVHVCERCLADSHRVRTKTGYLPTTSSTAFVGPLNKWVGREGRGQVLRECTLRNFYSNASRTGSFVTVVSLLFFSPSPLPLQPPPPPARVLPPPHQSFPIIV